MIVAPGDGLHGGDIGAGVFFGDREGPDRFAAGDAREIAAFERVGAEECDWTDAESLHREGEVREAGE